MSYPLRLRAYANPYAGGLSAFDHRGRAHAYATYPDAPDRIFGARVDEAASAKEGTVVLVFSEEPFDMVIVNALDFAHLRQQFIDGVLVAADAASARALGVPFAEPHSVLEQSRTAALAAWQREYGV